MWTHEYTGQSSAAPEAVWATLRDLHTGAEPDEGADRFEIHGPFAVGTELSITPQGQETFRSIITALRENEFYADQTQFGDVVLRFSYRLTPTVAGTSLTHRLEIDGDGADAVAPELGPQITEDFPQTMAALLARAERIASIEA